ncbi:TetR/AcrR family transcriptional regulator [Streptomyces sp. NPDC000594]|uniref:TetR/AcrR family transcriptional regulator n=1 Tax=Streptomyces sp. NPDC000594 TaxID=3154261 RepID=UPI0033197694
MRDEKKTPGPGCGQCGTALPAARRGRPSVYCSRSCQARAYRRRRDRLPGPGSPPPGERPTDTGQRQRQRRRIAEAVWRIAAGQGLDAASMRRIAAEAGVSLRVVRYHFDSKHTLLVDALRLFHEDSERLARTRMPAGTTDPRVLLRALLHEFLPLDRERAAALRVFAAYYARSLTDPSLAAVFLAAEHPLQRQAADLIAAGHHPAPHHEADLLIAGATGLGLDILHGRRTLAAVQAVLDYHLSRILPPDGAPSV